MLLAKVRLACSMSALALYLCILLVGFASCSNPTKNIRREYDTSDSRQVSMIYRTSSNYSAIVEIQRSCSFLMDWDRLEDSNVAFGVRNNPGKQFLVVYLTESFFNSPGSNEFKVESLASQFKDVTKMELKFVMSEPNLECRNLNMILLIFEERGIVFLNNYKVVDSIPDKFNQLMVVDYDSMSKSAKKSLKKQLKDTDIKHMKLSKYISERSWTVEVEATPRYADLSVYPSPARTDSAMHPTSAQSVNPINYSYPPHHAATYASNPSSRSVYSAVAAPPPPLPQPSQTSTRPSEISQRPAPTLYDSHGFAAVGRQAVAASPVERNHMTESYGSGNYDRHPSSTSTPTSSRPNGIYPSASRSTTARSSDLRTPLVNTTREPESYRVPRSFFDPPFSISRGGYASEIPTAAPPPSYPPQAPTSTLNTSHSSLRSLYDPSPSRSSASPSASYGSSNFKTVVEDDRKMPAYEEATPVTVLPSRLAVPKLLNKCKIANSFILLFSGIQYYDAIKCHDQNSSIIVTLSDLDEFAENIRRAVADRRKLVLALSTSDLVYLEDNRNDLDVLDFFVNDLILNPFKNRQLELEYVILPDGVSADVRNQFALHLITEIRISREFTAAESDFDRKLAPFNFTDIISVDLKKVPESPGSLLVALETKLETQDKTPLPIRICDFGNEDDAEIYRHLTEAEKRQELRRKLRASYTFSGVNMTINRNNIFEDSLDAFAGFSDLTLLNSHLAINYVGEIGFDAGGLTRDWYSLVVRKMFDPNYALFLSSETDQNVFRPNMNSSVNAEHLEFFQFVGRFIGKALIDGIPIDCQFSRAMYKLMLSKKLTLTDILEIDSTEYNSLKWIEENDVAPLAEVKFSVESRVFGQEQEVFLIENDTTTTLTEQNKFDYVTLKTEYILYKSCKTQIDAFLTGFHRLVPQSYIYAFTVNELHRLISGATEIDVEDWKANTSYNNGFNADSLQVVWFWQALRSFSQAELRSILRFVTGSPSVPSEGFRHLRSRGQICLFTINCNRFANVASLPIAHTCFNTIDLPLYPDYERLRAKLLQAAMEGSGNFLLC